MLEAFIVSKELKAQRVGMAQSQRKLVSGPGPALIRHGRHMLDELDPARVAKHLVMFEPTEHDLENLVAEARLRIPGLAPASEAIRVQRHNPFCILALARRSGFDPANPVGEGFIASLPLNALGLQMLALGTFDAASPDLRLLAKPSERPAGIYIWGVFAPGSLAGGVALYMEKVNTPQYAGVDLYSRARTQEGVQFHQVLGFKLGTTINSIEAPDVWIFKRRPEAPSYDSYVPGAAPGKLGITVARSFEDLSRVIAIRSAVYIGEQECPYEEEYDGNDLAATHLIAYIGDEPAGCLRLRFFADFAKVERLAVRKEFRKTRAAFQLVQAGLKLCQKKGYRRAYGHSQTRLVNFWSRFGFHTFEGGKSFVFSDFDYVEMVAELVPDQDAVAIGADPYAIIRPEGRWHMPGILERSAARAATSPSVKKA
ncbi:MAG TPA: GNAT family N-acetyltransferase [Rhizomicrobium sp.]|nr:GNAT family N-acetyltransferase [Rhizomicrobium sp.]